MPAIRLPDNAIRCPACGHRWGGRDTFASPGIFIPQHKCGHRSCGAWFIIVYRATLEWADDVKGGKAPRVRVEVEAVGQSYGPELSDMLDALVTMKGLPGSTLTDEEIRVAIAFASILSEVAA